VESPEAKPKPGRKSLTAVEKEDFVKRQSEGKNIAARKNVVNMKRATALSNPSTDTDLGAAPVSETNNQGQTEFTSAVPVMFKTAGDEVVDAATRVSLTEGVSKRRKKKKKKALERTQKILEEEFAQNA
jgi:hypothetical protein